MCLLIIKETPLLTAEKDIEVYKLFQDVAGKLYSPIMLMTYELNKLYTTNLTKTSEPKAVWDEQVTQARRILQNNGITEFEYVEEGFHSALEIPRFGLGRTGSIYRCIIPKGAKYYVGVTNLVVSNQIIVLPK